MNRRFCITLILVSVFYVSGVFGVDYDYNKEVKNTMPVAAYDLTLVLDGTETTTNHYDGDSAGPNRGTFSSFKAGTSSYARPQDTVRSWSGFSDGGNNAIDPDQSVHVGWSTRDHSSNVRCMVWTDKNGNEIGIGAFVNPTAVPVPRGPSPGEPQRDGYYQIIYNNSFAPIGLQQTITISNVHYAVIMAPVPLDHLNAQNAWLAAEFEPLPGGTSFNVPFGESVSLPIPGTVNSALVVRYEVSAVGSPADVIDFMQFVPDGPPIPTVSQWGLIAMAGLLLTVGAIVIVRHRRRVAA